MREELCGCFENKEEKHAYLLRCLQLLPVIARREEVRFRRIGGGCPMIYPNPRFR
jgi:hypothetical protein